MFVFGPVPSRRLGQSIGINSIPGVKQCSYDCVYCQVGPTSQQSIERRFFRDPEEIARQVAQKLEECRATGAAVDYVTFVPDGEPTLDINLKRAIELLRPLGCKLAIITNASLIDQEDVQEALLGVDWVSLKVDSVIEAEWRAVNRPHRELRLGPLLDGMRTFANAYRGELTTETLLVDGINDGEDSLHDTAALLAELKPSIAYVAAPTRPPAESWVNAPDDDTLNRSFQIFDDVLDRVEFLLGFAEDPFRATTDPAEGILAITAVHPMREEEALGYIEQMGGSAGLLDELVREQKLAPAEYGGRRFYTRRLRVD